MNVSDTCNAAADLIEVSGWTQGPDGWDHDGGAMCLEGALAAAAGITAPATIGLYSCPTYWAVAEYLDRNPMPRTAPVKDALWQWNDKYDRTADEVIATLRAVAVIHAAREDESVETRAVEAVAR